MEIRTYAPYYYSFRGFPYFGKGKCIVAQTELMTVLCLRTEPSINSVARNVICRTHYFQCITSTMHDGFFSVTPSQ